MLLLADVYKGVWLKGNNSSCYPPVMLPLLRFTKRSHFCHVTNGHPLATGFSDDTLVKTFNAGTRLWHLCVLEHISYSCGKWWQMKTSLNLVLDDLSVGGSGCCLLQKEKSWASLFYFDDERDREVTITIHQCNWSNHLCWHTIITSGTLCHRWSSCVLKVNCVTIDQSERITRMAITRSFPCSGSVCCGKFVAQIETFASHIGDTRCWHLQQLVCHKNCHFCVSSKCLCHTLRCHNMTQMCGSDYVGGPPALLLSPHAAAVRWLWEAEVCVRQGCRGWWGGRANLQEIFTFLKSESCSTHLKFCWDAVEGREKARGGAVYTVLGRTRWKTTSIWSATQIYLLLIFSPAFLKLIIDCYVLDCSSWSTLFLGTLFLLYCK